MTCKEFHNYWENDLRVTVNLQSDSAEFAEHVASCSECNRFIEEQKQLRKHLNVLRNSAPPIPALLDSAVVADYRRYVSGQSYSARSIPVTHRFNPRGALVWAAAVAFAIIVAYGGMLLFIPRQHVWVDRQVTARQQMAPQATALTANKETAGSQRLTHKPPKSLGAAVKRANNPAPGADQDDSFPTRFQSLMYCDQISCPSAMDVIRVQLPSPVLRLTPASARMKGAVSADVLVGPDGIARGIRVVE